MSNDVFDEAVDGIKEAFSDVPVDERRTFGRDLMAASRQGDVLTGFLGSLGQFCMTPLHGRLRRALVDAVRTGEADELITQLSHDGVWGDVRRALLFAVSHKDRAVPEPERRDPRLDWPGA